jgi:hypothetical protein
MVFKQRRRYKVYWELTQQLEIDNSTSIIRHNNAESLSNRTAGKKKMNRPVPKERIEKLVFVDFKLQKDLDTTKIILINYGTNALRS